MLTRYQNPETGIIRTSLFVKWCYIYFFFNPKNNQSFMQLHKNKEFLEITFIDIYNFDLPGYQSITSSSQEFINFLVNNKSEIKQNIQTKILIYYLGL